MIETFFEIFFLYIKSLILSPEKESHTLHLLFHPWRKSVKIKIQIIGRKTLYKTFYNFFRHFIFIFLWNQFGNSKENSRSPKRDSKDMEKQILEDS